MSQTPLICPLSISNNQITLSSESYGAENFTWNEAHLDQGVLWNETCTVFDSVADGDLDALILFEKLNDIDIDPNVQRAMLIPFEVKSLDQARVETVSDRCYLSIPSKTKNTEEEQKYGRYYLDTGAPFLALGSYKVLYQVCIGEVEGETEGDEVYYRFSFIPTKEMGLEALSLMDDEFGLAKNQKLSKGQL